MATLRDGLGGEEIAISGLQAGGVNISPYFTGSVTAVAGLKDGDGRIRSAAIGSPGAFGVIIQVGSFVTAGSTANVQFKTNFAVANDYFFQAWGRSGLQIIDATAAGSSALVTSGTANSGRHTSGVNVLGTAAAVLFDYLAIGQAA